MTDYCFNCLNYSGLADGTHCEWCLSFFYTEGRMPLPGDYAAEPTPVERLWARIDAMEPV